MQGPTQEPLEAPTRLGRGGWLAALKRVRPRIKQLNLGLLAAGVAFWATLAIFPTLIALVMVYGLVANPADVTRQVDNALSGLSKDAKHLIGDQVSSIAATRPQALSLGLVVSLVVLLWAASSAAQNLMRALTTAFEQEETRGFVKLRGTALLLAVAGIVLAAILVAAVGVVPALLRHFLSSPSLRWVLYAVEGLLLLLLLIGVITLLYRFAPANRPAGWRWASAGAVLAGVLMMLFTVAFAVYVNMFANYQKTYGTLAGVIVLMLWMYYSTYVLLLGALVDAEGERQAKGDAEAEPERVDRDVVRLPNEEVAEERLRPAR